MDDGYKGLRLTNTLTRRKEEFRPLDWADESLPETDRRVRMYVCGPTVYDYAHIGNARPVIVFGVLFRLLRHLYGADQVTYVRNITDVDDKIIARAAAEHPDLPLNEAIRKVTGETERQFHADAAALGCLEPTHEPRATEHIGAMREMIERLIASGNAYVAEEHVLFHVPSMPDYGRLSGRTLDEMVAGARVEVAPFKRDPMDFVLWKPSKSGEPAWPSPAGIATPGRPGWHIECSAMSEALLGPVFDIHGGGIDLVFPHHENEIAQSRCAHGTAQMARYWLHNGYLQVEGAKMSKSAGNFVTVRELLATKAFGSEKWSGEVIRLAMLMTHYREPLDWTVTRLQEARNKRGRWLAMRGVPEKGTISELFVTALSDDLNTAAGFTVLDELAARARSPGENGSQQIANELAATMFWLGIANDEDFAEARAESEDLRDEIRAATLGVDKECIRDRITARAAARKRKDWAEADRIRDELDAMGIALKDSRDPETGELTTTWELKR
jgi:cysteinyl-tRNA synthetase